jgi:hypothetical protein
MDEKTGVLTLAAINKTDTFKGKVKECTRSFTKKGSINLRIIYSAFYLRYQILQSARDVLVQNAARIMPNNSQ